MTAPTIAAINTLPDYVTNFINAGVGGKNPGLGVPILKQLAQMENVVVPGIVNNYPKAISYLGSPNQTPLNTLYNTALLGSSALTPDAAYLYGIGSGGINTAANYIMGGQQSPFQAFSSGYKFGAATAPLFELAGMASRAIDPLANALKDIDDKLLSEVITPKDAAAARAAIQANYDQILMRLGRFALRTAPLSSLFGAMNTGAQYMGGQRNPTALATAFGEGYGAGTLLQGAGEVLGPIFKKAGQALLYGLKSDLTGTSLGDMLDINIQKLDSAPSYGETPPEAEVAAAGKPEARMQYVRGYERPDGSYVPGYWRKYAPGISDEARGQTTSSYIRFKKSRIS